MISFQTRQMCLLFFSGFVWMQDAGRGRHTGNTLFFRQQHPFSSSDIPEPPLQSEMCSTETQHGRCQRLMWGRWIQRCVCVMRIWDVCTCWTNIKVLLRPTVTVTETSSFCFSSLNKWGVVWSVSCVIDRQTHAHLWTPHGYKVTVSFSFLQSDLCPWLHLAPPFPLWAQKQARNLEVKVLL